MLRPPLQYHINVCSMCTQLMLCWGLDVVLTESWQGTQPRRRESSRLSRGKEVHSWATRLSVFGGIKPPLELSFRCKHQTHISSSLVQSALFIIFSNFYFSFSFSLWVLYYLLIQIKIKFKVSGPKWLNI